MYVKDIVIFFIKAFFNVKSYQFNSSRIIMMTRQVGTAKILEIYLMSQNELFTNIYTDL